MEMTYDEYISFVNHLFIQEFCDVDYWMNLRESTVDAMTTL